MFVAPCVSIPQLQFMRCQSSEIVWLENLFYFIVVQVQVSAFSPTTPPHPSHPHLPPLITRHLGFVPVSFIVVPEIPYPFAPHNGEKLFDFRVHFLT